MKRSSSLLILVFSILLLTGCGKQKVENYKLELDANSTTGFTWKYDVETDGIIEVITDKYESSKSNRTGALGKQIYVFKGLKEGTTKIVLTYAQQWDQETPPSEIEEITLVVDKELNVTKK